MREKSLEILEEAHDVARSCGVVPATVRWWADKGWLRVAYRTPRGLRLFLPGDVEAFRRRREQRAREEREAIEA